MQYCTQCGTVISSQAKFCPSCGLEMSFKSHAVEKTEDLPGKMEKGVTKSLQDSAEPISKRQIQEPVDEVMPKQDTFERKTADTHQHAEPPEIPRHQIPEPKRKGGETQAKPGLTFWIWIYLVLNMALGFLAFRMEEVIWVLGLSLCIFLGVLIRKDKIIPFNWLIKIFIIGQMILLPELLYPRIQFMMIDAVTLLLLIILFLDIMMLFKGNRK